VKLPTVGVEIARLRQGRSTKGIFTSFAYRRVEVPRER
jgi:hypothetical protein